MEYLPCIFFAINILGRWLQVIEMPWLMLTAKSNVWNILRAKY